MLVAAGVCPYPPMLVPEVAQGLAGELEPCRRACARVIAELAGADRLVFVGAGSATRRHPSDARGSLAPYGVLLDTGPGDSVPVLPLSLTVGRWLLGDRAAEPCEIAAGAPPDACAALGRELVAGTERVALLAMADGSAYPLQTPVGDDGRGGRWDEGAVAALVAGDVARLLALDPADDQPLWVAGRPALQVLAGALAAAERPWQGTVLWRGSPYGVGYFVASLLPSGAAAP